MQRSENFYMSSGGKYLHIVVSDVNYKSVVCN